MLNNNSLLLLCLAAGIVLQATLLLRGRWNWAKTGPCLLMPIAIGALAFIDKQRLETEGEIILITASTFAIVFSLTFKKQILTPVTEHVLLSYTLTFWYAFFANYYKHTGPQNLQTYAALVPTVATLYAAFNPMAVDSLGRIFFYVWYLCLVVSIGLIQLSPAYIAVFSASGNLPWLSPTDAILAGMSFMYLAAHATFIYQAFRPDSEWGSHVNLLLDRMKNDQLSHFETVAIILLQGGGLLANYKFGFIDPYLLVNLLVMLPLPLYLLAPRRRRLR